MDKITVLAVDDEPLALRILEKYVAELPTLRLAATCANAFEALEILRRERVDVLLLDVNMPKLSGMGLLKSLDRPPLVIFTTAYPEFAVEGFELEAVDYLLKPFSLERFIKAINRAVDRFAAYGTPLENRPAHLLVKSDKKLYKIDFQDILRLEAYGDYVKIFTREKMLLTKERLAVLEESLPKPDFFRIHRSHIISLEAVEFIEGNLVSVGGSRLPVSEGLREMLVERLGGR